MIELVLVEILAVPAEPSRGRHNPRVVKRKMSNFPTKARAAPAPRRIVRYDEHIRILAPAAPPRHDPPHRPITDAGAVWLDHVRSWRRSGLPRTVYCQQHDLKPPAFNTWIARLRDRFRHPTKRARTS
jgi:hypothetical protein